MSAPPALRGCTSCGNLSFSQEWYEAFGVVLCIGCKAQEELIPKVLQQHFQPKLCTLYVTRDPALPQSTVKQLYLLTDGDLKKLGSIQKENPHQKQWNPMRLYMQSQVPSLSCNHSAKLAVMMWDIRLVP